MKFQPGSSQKRLMAAPVYLLAIIAVFWVKNNVFFWDTIQLGARHALWYYEQGFRYLLLPPEIDSGHPPVFGAYLAFLWSIFGMSLPTSHFAMLPFLLGIVFFTARLAHQIAPEAPLGPLGLWLLLIVDPVLAAQCLLISPDIWLVLGFLAGLDGILRRSRWLRAAGALLLAATSMRGMMVLTALFFFDLLRRFLRGNPEEQPRAPLWAHLLSTLLPYVPAGIFGMSFLVVHYLQTGWIGFHADSPWAPAFQRSDWKGVLFNTGIFAWRLLDFGRVFLWLGLGVAGWRLWRRKTPLNHMSRQLLLLFLLLLLLLSPSLLLYKLSMHRYILPLYLSVTFLFFHLLFAFPSLPHRIRYLLYALGFTGLLAGNFWIYPRHIAQGWDATLAHLPYYSLREEVLDFMQSRQIPLEATGTAFPEIGPLHWRDLSGRMKGMVEKDLEKQEFIFYSNVMNDFTDAELRLLDTHWIPLQKRCSAGVCVILYQKK